MTEHTLETLAIVGSGQMGRGIAQIAAAAERRVLLYDTRPGAVDEAIAFVSHMYERAVEKDRMTAAAAAAARARLIGADSLAALAEADLVIEAVVEDLGVKRALVRDLEELVRDDCILATNTSSLSVTEIAAAARRPERVAGFHFFNPVPLMKVVEVIAGLRTADWVGDALLRLAMRMGHVPVRVTDTPGFLVNHAGRAFLTEALQIVKEGVCDIATIDRILRDGVGFRMGPFELMDLTALDVTHPVMEQIYAQSYHEPRLRPSVITQRRLLGGLLGQKVGGGFYPYADGQIQRPPRRRYTDEAPRTAYLETAALEDEEALRFESSPDVLAALGRGLDRIRQDLIAAGVQLIDDPRDADVLIAFPLGNDCATEAVMGMQLRRQGDDVYVNPAETVAIDLIPGFDGTSIVERVATVMSNAATQPHVARSVVAALDQPDRPAVWIEDSPGFVAQRVIAAIVNLSCDIAQQKIALPGDIDTAVRLALGYPKGPLALGDTVGRGLVLGMLENLSTITGDPRYRPSLWLARRTVLGLPLIHRAAGPDMA